MKTNEVYGVSNEMVETYIEREKVDSLFTEGLSKNKHIIIYGASKQGKTSLTNKHLTANDYVKVNCSPSASSLDIYNSIVRQLDLEIIDMKEESSTINGEVKVGLKAKIKIPFLTSSEGGLEGKAGKENTATTKFKIVDYNLALAQDLSELLRNVNFSKRIILENFHYLDIEVQKQLAIDLRIFEDYNILFIILGIWRERNRLSQFNGDLLDRMIEIPVEPWEKEDLKKIVETGLPLLNVSFEGVVDYIIDTCFDSVGVFQEICKESCYLANISETSEELIEITEEVVNQAITKKLEDYSNRHVRSLETFIEQTARSSEETPLYMSYYFVKVLMSESFEDIVKGMKRRDLHDKIKNIHHRPDDVRPSDMGYFLKTIVNSQLKKSISPPIFDYDEGTNTIKIIDSTFYFFLKNANRQEVINEFSIPTGLS